jgi:hypothetical protein
MSAAPISKRSSQPLQEQVQLNNQIAWLTYVQNKAKTGEGENYDSLRQLLERIPFQSPMPSEIQTVVNSVKKAVESKIFDPDLSEQAANALRIVRSQHSFNT